MADALVEAGLGFREGEVPVGAVVVDLNVGQVVGRGRDRRVALGDPTAHAEVLALREAGIGQGDWRLENHGLIVTLEPCLMCAGASLLARIPLVVFGARSPKFGAVGGQLNALDHPGWNHHVRVVGGIRSEECSEILRRFFAGKRSRGVAADEKRDDGAGG